MAHRGVRLAGALVLGAALLVLAAAAVSPLRSYQQARRAWAARPFADYRLTLVHSSTVGDFLPSHHHCTMTVEVRAGVARLVAGDCPAPIDVEAIFDRFERYMAAPIASRRCGYGSCTCALSTVRAHYDPQLGHPTLIARDWRDVTAGAGPVWGFVAHLPAPARRLAFALADLHNPCPPGTLNHTPTISPIHSEEFRVIRLTPRP